MLSSADRVTRELRQAIVMNEFVPGQRLAAESLVDRFDVSPTPLREAFARLAGEGFVEYQPQRGVRVAGLSIEQMNEIYELREMLEPMAIQRSTDARDDEWLVEVTAKYEAMVRLGDTDVLALDPLSYDEYEEAHTAFHEATMSRCGSSWLIRLSTMLIHHSRRFRQASIPLRPREDITREHRAIFDACRSFDGESAAAAYLQHIQHTREAIASTF